MAYTVMHKCFQQILGMAIKAPIYLFNEFYIFIPSPRPLKKKKKMES